MPDDPTASTVNQQRRLTVSAAAHLWKRREKSSDETLRAEEATGTQEDNGNWKPVTVRKQESTGKSDTTQTCQRFSA